MNDMAVLDGRFMPKMSAAAHDIIYNESVNNANMPTFMPVKSPLRDTGALALIPNNPTPHAPIILADTPTTEAAEKPDIILRDERGRNVAPTVPLGLATQHDIVNSEKESLPTEPEHPPVYENPTVQQVPPVTDQQMEADTLIPTIHPDQPVEADTLIPTIHTQEPAGEEQQQSHQFRLPVRMSLRHSTRLQQRHSTEDQVLVTSGVTSGVTGVKVGLSGSAVESITAFLEKRKREGTADPSSNTSVRQALNSRGEEAEKVIMKELAQMDKLKVWKPIHGGSLDATQRAAVIRSSMFLKRKTHPDGSFDKYKARLVAGGDQQDKDLYSPSRQLQRTRGDTLQWSTSELPFSTR